MINEELLVAIITKLQAVKDESSSILREVRLKQYVHDITDNNEYMLVSLILGFQLSNILDSHKPKFNTIEVTNFPQDIFSWINGHRTRKEFVKLPYTVQVMINFMKSPSSLGLSVESIACMDITYTDPYQWLVDNIS